MTMILPFGYSIKVLMSADANSVPLKEVTQNLQKRIERILQHVVLSAGTHIYKF